MLPGGTLFRNLTAAIIEENVTTMTMRVSDAHRHATVLRQLVVAQRAVAEANRQAATGARADRLSALSDGGRQLLGVDSQQRAAAQYARNIASARHRLEAVESITHQVIDVLARAKELAAGQIGSTASAGTRAATAIEVTQLRDQVISLGNLAVGGEFLLGGQEVTVAPFQADGTYIGTGTERLAELGAGPGISVIPTGEALLVSTGVIAQLGALATALNANDTAGIQTAMTGLDGAFDEVQQQLAELGSRDRSLELAELMLTSERDRLMTRRSTLHDLPLEEAVMRLAAAQSSLEAAYLTVSRTLSMSLASYLR